VIDGDLIAALGGGLKNAWVGTARDLATIRDGGVPASLHPAQPAARRVFGFPDGSGPFNDLQYDAVFCNEGTGGRDFEPTWAAESVHANTYPDTPVSYDYPQWCADWPWPAQPWQPVKGAGEFQISGHVDEIVTPYAFAEQAHDALGGGLIAISDFDHGGLTRIPCASKAIAFFRGGHATNGTCPGSS
jgi:hypothetical protein